MTPTARPRAVFSHPGRDRRSIDRVVLRFRSLHPWPTSWGVAAPRDGYVHVTLARVRWAERPLPARLLARERALP